MFFDPTGELNVISAPFANKLLTGDLAEKPNCPKNMLLPGRATALTFFGLTPATGAPGVPTETRMSPKVAGEFVTSEALFPITIFDLLAFADVIVRSIFLPEDNVTEG